MNSEENLKILFESLRSEKASTSIADVTSWIHASTQISASQSNYKMIIQKTLFIIGTISIATAVGGLLLFRENPHSRPNPQEKNETIESVLDTSNKDVIENNGLPKLKSSVENNLLQPVFDLSSEPLCFLEIESSPIMNRLDTIRSLQNPSNRIHKPIAGHWLSKKDILKVDTLFRGVKELVFKGDKCDLVVRGSDRSDVSMKYDYQFKAKGVFSGKTEANCTLRYEVKDSILTVHVERSHQKLNGVSVLSENSKLEFNVPEGIDVRLDSDLGDIDVNCLKANTTKVYTALGDITAENVSGNIYLCTDLGDISMNQLQGKIKSVTSLGDIIGENVLIADNSEFHTSLGDIEVQFVNPLSDCSLDLSSSLGKVKIDRPDLKKKASSQLNIGNGKWKVIMETSLGKVIVR
jgi:hypothetical protein